MTIHEEFARQLADAKTFGDLYQIPLPQPDAPLKDPEAFKRFRIESGTKDYRASFQGSAEGGYQLVSNRGFEPVPPSLREAYDLVIGREAFYAPALRPQQSEGPEVPVEHLMVRGVQFSEVTLYADHLHADYPKLPKRRLHLLASSDGALVVDHQTTFDILKKSKFSDVLNWSVQDYSLGAQDQRHKFFSLLDLEADFLDPEYAALAQALEEAAKPVSAMQMHTMLCCTLHHSPHQYEPDRVLFRAYGF